MIPFETRKRLYKTFLMPHFNYCAKCCHFCSKRATEKLEKLNGLSLCFVWPNLNNQILVKILSTVFEIVNCNSDLDVNDNELTVSLLDQIKLRESGYILNGASPMNYAPGVIRQQNLELATKIDKFRSVTSYKVEEEN